MKLHNLSLSSLFSSCVLFSQDGAFTKGEVVAKPDVKNFGQSSFVDFDGDGYQDHLLPACLDNDCQQSTIYLAKRSSKERWLNLMY
ncbi:hypothetical protein AMECASPLE_012845 [Ameca splendens]|uniref:VCBS repeat-containing protein n=1 Tax=Ameca splendens TaxID=208324 RepID=A0ABV0ZAD6_9TELE